VSARGYQLTVCRFHSLTTAKAAEHAGADVVKASDSPLMSSMLYPGLQALDEQYLGVDFQFGGVDQVSLPPWNTERS
jgi:tyrosyl-tRNA synthetase